MPLDLRQLAVGDRVQHTFRVVDRIDRATVGKEPYVIFTLGNATGQIDTEPIWSNQLAAGWAEGIGRGAIVQAIGTVVLYQRHGGAKRQLRLSTALHALPHEAVSLEALLPHVARGQLDRLWERIDRVRARMQSRTLRGVVDLFFGAAEFRARFERTPGSIIRHHVRLGGLLLHTTEVMEIARTAARPAGASLDLVTVGALLHDIGKVEAYVISPGGFDYTPCGRLVGHVVLGALLLQRRLTSAGTLACTDGQILELQHLILAHHGTLEFGSPVEPMTIEAELIHWADEASAKGNAIREALDDPDVFGGGEEFSRGHWRLKRHLWRRSHGWE